MAETAAQLFDEVLKSLETGERGVIEAVRRFVIAVEEALPQEVAATPRRRRRSRSLACRWPTD